MSDYLPSKRGSPPVEIGTRRHPGAGYSPLDQLDAEGEGFSISEVLGALRRNLALVVVATLVTGSAAAYVAYNQRPQYRAQAVVRLEDPRQALSGGLGGAAMDGAFGATDPLLSQLQVLRSRGLAQSVVTSTPLRLESLTDGFSSGELEQVRVSPEVGGDTLQLRFWSEGYEMIGSSRARAQYGEPVKVDGVRATVSQRPSVETARMAVLPIRVAAEMALENLTARPRERTNVVDIEFTAYDPVVAMKAVNAFADGFQLESARAAQQQSRRRRLFVEEQLQTTDSVLAVAQTALTNFRSSRQVYSSRDMLSAQQQGMMGLDVRREELAADRRMYASLLSQLQRASPAERGQVLRTLVSSPGISSNPVIAQLFSQLMQYQTARDSMTTGPWSAAETHPDVRRLGGLIASTQGQLIEAVRSHISSLDARLTALNELHAQNSAQLQNLPSSEAEEMRLLREVETASRMAGALREELQKARIAEAVEAGQVEIVDLAGLPTEPIGSGRARTIVLGLLIGLMFGSGGALLRERMNTSIRHKDEMAGTLQVPSLGLIPRIGPARQPVRRLVWPGGKGKVNGNGRGPEPIAPELVTISDSRTSGAEAYRSLRTNLLFSQSIQTIRTLVVTSASPGEGKTTTAANLAVTYAQQGMRVLLMECDLRKPRLHKVFRVKVEPGVTQVVFGMSPVGEAIRETQERNLFLLPAGQLPPNPAEFVGGEGMRALLETLAEQFDIVVMDSPPLLAASDAAILGTRADGVLLVVKAGETQRAAAQHAVEQLQNVGARVVGAVLNDPNAQVPKYGAYYQYEYYGAET